MDGRISELKVRLEAEVESAGVASFEIFQDVNSIKWGQAWQERVEREVASSAVLIPVIAPLYFHSDWCRKELEIFVAVERSRGRRDSIFPILWINTPGLTPTSDDPLKAEIALRSYVDWTDLRHDGIASPGASRAISRMAEQIAGRLLNRPSPGGGESVRSSTANEPASRTTPAQGAAVEIDLSPLVKLFLSLFSGDELRRFLQYGRSTSVVVARLPGPTASPYAVATEAADLLLRDGRIDEALFAALVEHRPGRKGDIDRVKGPLLTKIARD